MGSIGFASLPFGILETGGPQNDPIPELRRAGIGSCPECKTEWSDDVKKFRPIQEICGHIKCRQCFIKAVASNEDNCFQCDQTLKAKEAAAPLTPKIIPKLSSAEKTNNNILKSKPTAIKGKIISPKTNARKRKLSTNKDQQILDIQSNLPVSKSPKKKAIKSDKTCPVINSSIGNKSQTKTIISLGNPTKDLANNNNCKINFKTLLQKKKAPGISFGGATAEINGKTNGVIPGGRKIKTGSESQKNNNLNVALNNNKSLASETTGGEAVDGKVRRKTRKPVVIPEFVKIVETTDNTPSLFHCLKCGKKFKTKAHIKYHEFCADPDLKPYVCEICNKSFIAKSHFEYHQRTHTGERPYKCPKCFKGFNQKGKVTRHMRSHTGEKPYSCSQCGKNFANMQALRSHVLIHTGERPFPCDFCDKRFTGQTNLKKHLIVHTGERPFECNFCKKRFGLKWTLDLHVRTHSSDKPYACDECDRAFSNGKDLKRHKIIHTGLRPFPCKICGTAFKRKDNLERHIRMTHSRSKEDASTLSQIAAIEFKQAEVTSKKVVSILMKEVPNTEMNSESNTSSEQSNPAPIESYVEKAEPLTQPEPIETPAFQDVLDFGSREDVNENQGSNQITPINENIMKIEETPDLEITADLTDKEHKPFSFLETFSQEELKSGTEATDSEKTLDIFHSDNDLHVDETATLCSQSITMLLRPEESENKPPESVSKWEEIIAGTPPEEHLDCQDIKPIIKTEASSDTNADIFDIMCEHDDYEVMRF